MLLIILFDKILNKKVLENKVFKFFCNNSILIFSLIPIIISCIFGDDLTNKVSSLFNNSIPFLIACSLDWILITFFLFSIISSIITLGFS